MKATALERKLAYLLRAAVIDAQRVEHLATKEKEKGKKPKLELDMWTYLNKLGDTCYMCMGGARAILGMGASIKVDDYVKWPSDIRLAAQVVDRMRKGDFRQASIELSGGRLVAQQLDSKKMRKADHLVHRSYDRCIGRAPFETYLQAACVLLGEDIPVRNSPKV